MQRHMRHISLASIRRQSNKSRQAATDGDAAGQGEMEKEMEKEQQLCITICKICHRAANMFEQLP